MNADLKKDTNKINIIIYLKTQKSTSDMKFVSVVSLLLAGSCSQAQALET